METDLHRKRVAASEASGGSSSSPVYITIDRLLRDYNLTGSVLDYGAGVGHLTNSLALSRRFTKVSGADLMPRPRDLAASVDWITNDLNEVLPAPDACYDVVVAAEVIEHLENPRAMLRDIFRVLCPGGTVILTTPNNESFRALLSLVFRGHFVHFLDESYPAHITALLRKDLARILTETGFAHPAFSFTDHGSVPKFPAISWQRLSMGTLQGIRFSDNLVAIATKPK